MEPRPRQQITPDEVASYVSSALQVSISPPVASDLASVAGMDARNAGVEWGDESAGSLIFVSFGMGVTEIKRVAESSRRFLRRPNLPLAQDGNGNLFHVHPQTGVVSFFDHDLEEHVPGFPSIAALVAALTEREPNPLPPFVPEESPGWPLRDLTVEELRTHPGFDVQRAVLFAIWTGNGDMFRRLYAAGFQEDCIEKAIHDGPADCFAWLVEGGLDVNSDVPTGFGPMKALMRATNTHSPKVVASLLRLGADPTAVDKVLQRNAVESARRDAQRDPFDPRRREVLEILEAAEIEWRRGHPPGGVGAKGQP